MDSYQMLDAETPKARQRARGYSMVLMLLLGCLLVTGCKGCTWFGSAPTQKKLTDAEKKKLEEQKLRLSVRELLIRPSQEGQAINNFKPGHWYQARQEVKANQSDEVLDVVAELADRRMDPIPLRGSSLFLRYKREAALVKGQSKTSDLLFHIPDMPAELDENGLPAKPTMRMMYNQRGLGAPLADSPSASNLARPEQYSVVVLAKDANRQSFWPGLNCMTWPSTALIDDSKKTSPHRPVVVAEKDASKSLPSNALMWTSISHLIWYDADPSVISEEQQQAILDWIHSGGQLIISGPDGLSAVNQSFLSSTLPATQLETSSLDATLADRFASAWRIAKAGDDAMFRLPAMRAIPLLQGELKEGAHWIDGADGLVASIPVGNGSVAMTMFPLSDDAFVRWRGFSSFINGAILKHPPRNWVALQMEGEYKWTGKWYGREGDPEMSTTVRLLTRDGRRMAMAPRTRPTESDVSKQEVNTEGVGNRARSVGSWNDESVLSSSAIDSLTAAAGITVPKVGFIIKLLAGYLLVLVPLNWLIFRLIGRVEYAWVAVPVIAIIGATVVAKSVQLDIGFSRSETRLSCLELYEGYDRAHHTTYVSLYTSLSEAYKVLFPKGDGVVLPTVTGSTSAARARRERQTLEYVFASDEGSGLKSYPVRSNSTGMLHSEEWVSLGGPIRAKVDKDAGRVTLENQSKVDLRDVAILGAPERNARQTAWVGDLFAGQKKEIELQLVQSVESWFEQWNERDITRKYESVLSVDGRQSLVGQQEGVLSVGQMMDSAIRSIEFRPGKFVAVGRIDHELGDLNISPKASQQNRNGMFVLHLTSGQFGSLGPDLSLPPKITELDEAPSQISDDSTN